MDEITAANELTARWVSACPDSSTVLAGVGVWPLLAFLAAGADGPGRSDLEAAVGLGAAEAPAAARRVIDALQSSPAARAAVGIWNSTELTVSKRWLEELPDHAHGVLTGDTAADRAYLDSWVTEATGGLIEHMPVRELRSTDLLLASALAVRTTWLNAFTRQQQRVADGPWRGRTLAGLIRKGTSVDDLTVITAPCGPVTMLRVAGEYGVDVHLLQAELTPAQVLTAGLERLAGRHPGTAGSSLDYGSPAPGVAVSDQTDTDSHPKLVVNTPEFKVTAQHDLLALSKVFGLQTVSTPGGHHFPGIAADPLRVREARQDAVAIFGPKGFEAAAVTAIAAMRTAFMRPGERAKHVTVTFDRPFGFIAIDRRSGLVLVTGWVADPIDWTGF